MSPGETKLFSFINRICSGAQVAVKLCLSTGHALFHNSFTAVVEIEQRDPDTSGDDIGREIVSNTSVNSYITVHKGPTKPTKRTRTVHGALFSLYPRYEHAKGEMNWDRINGGNDVV